MTKLSGRIVAYFRTSGALYKRSSDCGVIFHSRKYSRALTGKRRNTYCCFLSNGTEEIELFVNAPEPCAVIRPLSSTLPYVSTGGLT